VRVAELRIAHGELHAPWLDAVADELADDAERLAGAIDEVLGEHALHVLPLKLDAGDQPVFDGPGDVPEAALGRARLRRIWSSEEIREPLVGRRERVVRRDGRHQVADGTELQQADELERRRVVPVAVLGGVAMVVAEAQDRDIDLTQQRLKAISERSDSAGHGELGVKAAAQCRALAGHVGPRAPDAAGVAGGDDRFGVAPEEGLGVVVE
jgi:hypothetical protein